MRYRLVLKDEDIDLSKMDTYELKDLAKKTKDKNILRKLAEDEDYWIRRGVAQNTNAPASVLRKLSAEEEYNLREDVAKHPNCPLDVLKKLAEDDYWIAREYAKSNPKFKKYVKSLNLSPLEELDYMAEDDKINLAKNTKDAEILRKLAEDNDGWVRKAVAQNPNCPIDTENRLSNTSKKFKITEVVDEGYSPGGVSIGYTIKTKGKEFTVHYEGYETEDIQELIHEGVFEAYSKATGKDEDEVTNNVGNSVIDWEIHGDVRLEEAIEEALEYENIEFTEEEINTIANLIGSRLDKDIEKYYSFNQSIVDDFNKWYRNN